MKTKCALKVWMYLFVILLFLLSVFSCASNQLSDNGWKIKVDEKKENLTIVHQNLDILLDTIRLGLIRDNTVDYCSQWESEIVQNVITVTAMKPQKTTWEFHVRDNVMWVKCSSQNGVLEAQAPADKNRIPARIEEQDNGVLYTSLGQVSAFNIFCLFDRVTDTMIKFPQHSLLSRNADDENKMEVAFSVKDMVEVTLVPDYYINVLGLKYYQPKREFFKTAPVAWSSWYCYYMGTTEQDVMNETDVLAEHLKPYGLEYIQLDACYTRGAEANYLEWTKETFPSGGKQLFQYVQDKGLKPALWVNVYGSNYHNAEMSEKYPDNYYLRDKNGKLSSACCTADTTVVRLDYSNPEVIDTHLKPMFRILKDDWGIKYLKDAGWGTWIDYFNENKVWAFDSTKTGRELYLEVQKALRETVGNDFYIGGCAMHEVGLGFGIFDGSRIGGDDRAIWYPKREGGMSMQTYFHSLFGGNYLNNIVWHCDPDAAMVRSPLTLEEGRTVVTAIGLTGQLYMASDFMGKLSQRKLELYQKTIPTTPIVPIDLYPYKIESNKRNGAVWSCPRVKEFPRAIDLKVNHVAGIYDVVSIFNWKDKQETKELSFSQDLGLDPDRKYIVFDFWNQKLEGVYTDNITVSVPVHGTRVLIIKPVSETPQLLSVSRHITTTVSLKTLQWDQEEKQISGTSQLVEGGHYSLFFFVPDGFEVREVQAENEVLYHKMTGKLLEVALSGNIKKNDDNNISWSVQF